MCKITAGISEVSRQVPLQIVTHIRLGLAVSRTLLVCSFNITTNTIVLTLAWVLVCLSETYSYTNLLKKKEKKKKWQTRRLYCLLFVYFLLLLRMQRIYLEEFDIAVKISIKFQYILSKYLCKRKTDLFAAEYTKSACISYY